jgi:Flp pilus assembly protein TadG
MSLVFVALGFMAFLAVSSLAIDVGLLMTARSQAQNAADASALAGAVALVYDDFYDRSATGPAVQNALSAAAANPVVGTPVSITPADIAFPNDPGGQPNRVQVTVFRAGSRSNALPTFIGQYLGTPTADITATAIAEAAPANRVNCLKPFTIPDRWIEVQTPPWDPDDTFDLAGGGGKGKGKGGGSSDTYVPIDQPGYTGYDPYRDRGLQIVIKAGTGNNITPSFYFAWRMPGSSGAADYRWNIENCNPAIVNIFDLIGPEPGNMVGPTAQGVQALIDKDPTAYWDTTSNKVASPMYPSPRIGAIPVFDPVYYETGKQNGSNADLKVANFIGVFFEGMQGGDVIARITPIPGLIDGSAGTPPAGAFPRAIRLIQ